MLSLAARAVLGPRPRRFAVRMASSLVMLAAAAYSGLICLRASSASNGASALRPRACRRTTRAASSSDACTVCRPACRWCRCSAGSCCSSSKSGTDRLTFRTYDATLEASCRRRLTKQATANRAIAAAVRALKQQMPDYTWVGIYLLDGNELVLGPVRRQAVAPHPHSARARHLRRRRHRENHDHRRRRELRIRDIWRAASRHGRRSSCRSCSDGEVLGEIDIDSDRLAAFGQQDQAMLEAVAARLAPRLKTPQTEDPRTLEPWNLRTPNL